MRERKPSETIDELVSHVLNGDEILADEFVMMINEEYENIFLIESSADPETHYLDENAYITHVYNCTLKDQRHVILLIQFTVKVNNGDTEFMSMDICKKKTRYAKALVKDYVSIKTGESLKQTIELCDG